MTPNSFLPRSIDNTYGGQKLALWVLGLIVLVKGVMGINSVFNGYKVATSADHIPLDTFTPAAANAVITFLAFWGLSQLLFALLGVLALMRYRAMVPLVFILLLVELLGRKLILAAMPIAKASASGAFPINLILIGMLLAGLVLSLWRPQGAHS